MKRNILAWVLGTVMATGCADVPADSSAAIGVAHVNQQWSLVSVGEWRLPVSIGLQPTVSRQIRAGQLLLAPDGMWTFSIDHRDTGLGVDQAAVSQQVGRYTIAPGEPRMLTLTETGSAATYTGTIDDETGLDVMMGGRRYHFTPAP